MLKISSFNVFDLGYRDVLMLVSVLICTNMDNWPLSGFC